MKIPPILIIAASALVFAGWSTNRLMQPRIIAAPVQAPARSGVLSATGMVEPRGRLLRLAPAAPGLITAIHVRVGDQVRRGQPLIDQDRRVAEARVAVARADVARLRAWPRREDLDEATARRIEAEARANEAAARRDEARRLTQQPAAFSDAERDRRERTAEAAAAGLAAAVAAESRLRSGAWPADLAVAEAALAAADAALDQLRITAPADGVVLRLGARLGEAAEHAEEPLIVIGDTSAWQVRAAVDEELLPRLRAGSATAHVRGDGERTISLRWNHVEGQLLPKGMLSGNANERVDTRALDAWFDVVEPQANLIAGQVVDVRWDTDAR
jgi:multidrug resistance efflux pump